MVTGEAERPYLSALHRRLTQTFNQEELRTLCFDLGIDYDDLPGEGKSGKARELVSYLSRAGRLPRLIEAARDLRPDVAWQPVPEDIVRPNTPVEIEDSASQLSKESRASAEHGVTFNMTGSIQSGTTIVGGSHTFAGPINVDMHEAAGHSQVAAVLTTQSVGFDDSRRVVHSIESRLAHVARAIDALSAAETEKVS